LSAHLGQLGASVRSRTISAPASTRRAYTFDQNDKDWSGSVAAVSQQQISDYNAAHPGRTCACSREDDDTACESDRSQSVPD